MGEVSLCFAGCVMMSGMAEVQELFHNIRLLTLITDVA
jgi:hypothetical protein